MKALTRKTDLLLPVLLAAMALRAFVPVGYMPASPGDGLLFVACHEMSLIDMSSMNLADGEHSHHATGHEHHDGSQAASDTCSLGHILSIAFVDGAAPIVVVVPGFDGLDTPEPVAPPRATRRTSYDPRGPPQV